MQCNKASWNGRSCSHIFFSKPTGVYTQGKYLRNSNSFQPNFPLPAQHGCNWSLILIVKLYAAVNTGGLFVFELMIN